MGLCDAIILTIGGVPCTVHPAPPATNVSVMAASSNPQPSTLNTEH